MTKHRTSAAEAEDGLGLGRMAGLNLTALMSPAGATEKFQELELGRIREDGANPRRDFDPETLKELAETVKARGVITPISVRPDPENPDGFLVNHGHRRLRAAKMAGLAVIPAVVDESFRDEDRIIENIQRDNLGMFEVAAYIERKLGEGLKQKEVAARIGKSTAYVSNHVQLLELPPATAEAVEREAVQDLTTIAELAKLEKKRPGEVKRFLSGRQEVSRSAAKELRERLEQATEKAARPAPSPGDPGTTDEGVPELKEPVGDSHQENTTKDDLDYAGQGRTVPAGDGFSETREVTSGWRQGRVIVEHADRNAALLLERRPRDERHAWIRYKDGEHEECEAALEQLKLLAVVEAGFYTEAT